MGWATSVNAHGLTHAGRLYEQNGVKGVAGFQGIGPFISPPSASVTRAVGVKGQILGESPGATIDNAYAVSIHVSATRPVSSEQLRRLCQCLGRNHELGFLWRRRTILQFGKSLFGEILSQTSSSMAFGRREIHSNSVISIPMGTVSTIGATFARGFLLWPLARKLTQRKHV